MNKQYLSYYGDKRVKANYLARLKKHYLANEIVQETYWRNERDRDEEKFHHYEEWKIQPGIPSNVNAVINRIFEGLPKKEAKEFPLECSSAIPVGVDLSNVLKKLYVWILTDSRNGVIQYAEDEKAKNNIQSIADMHAESITDNVSETKWVGLRASAAIDASEAKSSSSTYASACAVFAAASDDYAIPVASSAAASATSFSYTGDAITKDHRYAYTPRQKYYRAISRQLIKLLKECKNE